MLAFLLTYSQIDKKLLIILHETPSDPRRPGIRKDQSLYVNQFRAKFTKSVSIPEQHMTEMESNRE